VGEPDARVSRGAFDDGAAGLEQACFLGVLDDEERRAVFDGAAWVLELGFAEDVAAGLFGELLQADEGRFADCWGRISVCSSVLSRRSLGRGSV
jgi:hypothetical protein